MLKSGRFWVGVVLAAVAVIGCAKETDPWLIRLAGRKIPVSAVSREYDRLKGVDQWSVASPEQRREFVSTFADKEALVQKARETYKKLPQREQLIFDRWFEKHVNGVFWLSIRESIVAPESIMDSLTNVCSQQRSFRHVVCTYEEDAREIYAKIQGGASYADVASAYNARDPQGVRVAEISWVVRPELDPIVGDALFGLTKPGDCSTPVESQYGWHVIRCDSIRQISREEARVFAEQSVNRIYTSKLVGKRVGDIAKDYDFKIIEENVGPIQRHFAAMYDSLDVDKQAGRTLDYQALPPPIHRFSAEERALPLVQWSGGVMTVGDFVNSLWKVDLDFWPTVGDASRIVSQIKKRLTRWSFAQEAAKAKTAENPDIVRDVRRKEDELFLERFHNDRLKVYADRVTEEQVRDFWNQSESKYTTRDLVAYSWLRFPGDALELARRSYDLVQGGSQWGMVSTGARKNDPRVEFYDEVDPTDGPPYPEITRIAMNYEPIGPNQPYVTEPIQVGDSWVLIRVSFRSRPLQLTYEVAKEFVWRDVQRLAMEDSLQAMLASYKQEYDLAINDAALEAKD